MVKEVACESLRIVVTGASGFLGHALMEQLACVGVDIIGVSRQRRHGLVQVESYADAPVGDVLVHLAEANDRTWVEAHAQSYRQAALQTLKTLLSKGYTRVVYASSAVLYGDRCEQAYSACDPVHLVDAYTRLKHESEQAVLGRAGVVARLVNLYGPGMAEGNVLNTILKQLPLEGPVRVLDAAPVRDFLWIEDAARALAAMALGQASGVFNVGTGVGTSIQQLASLVLEAAGQAGRPVETTRPGGTYSRLVVDIAQTESAFGWHPSITLAEGIGTLVKMIK